MQSLIKRFGCIGSLIVILVAGFLLIQIIPYGRAHQNPPVVSEPAWDSPQTRALAKRACFDCHSNETVWPWYSNIAPASWLNQRDVDEGRQRLNFSDWRGVRSERGREREGGGDDLARVIQEGSMPPWYYTIIHTNAVLNDQERQQLITGLQNSLK